MKHVGTYEPLNVLKSQAEDLWIVDGPIIHMQQFGFNVPFSTRMTVVRLSGGSLFVHSPTAPTKELYRQIDDLGPVAHLVSPNKIHYAYIHPWAQRYPQARCWASPGVRERATQKNIEVHFDENLADSAPEDWAMDIDQLIFGGSRFMEEVVFFHRSSRTLILADLIENMEPSKLSAPMRLLARMGGVLDPDGRLPFDLRMTFRGRHKRACASLARMLDWQPEKIIVAHGRCYEENGMAELKRAFRWLSCPSR